jgi:hypothetical protein
MPVIGFLIGFSRLAAVFIIRALAGCAKVATSQGQALFAPYSLDPNGELLATGVVTAAGRSAPGR